MSALTLPNAMHSAAPTAAALRATKTFSTLQARCALALIGLEAIETDDGSVELIATSDALTQRFSDLGAVEAWLDHLGSAS